MAEVVLSRADVALPPVCVGCGRPATGTRRVRVLGPSSGVATMFGEYALDNLERMARGPGRIRLPVCWWHRWIVPPSVSATAGNDGKTHLTGLSAEFAKAMG
jgi:hypothetical protein